MGSGEKSLPRDFGFELRLLIGGREKKGENHKWTIYACGVPKVVMRMLARGSVYGDCSSIGLLVVSTATATNAAVAGAAAVAAFVVTTVVVVVMVVFLRLPTTFKATDDPPSCPLEPSSVGMVCFSLLRGN